MEGRTIRLTGNTAGLKASPLQRLERLANRRSKSDCIVAPELARALTEISLEIGRQIGVLLDRRGHICSVIVGNARSLFLPDMDDFRRGRDRLSGLRLVHTHLNHEPLTEEDLTDLALLRFDVAAAIEVQDDGLPGKLYAAHLVPDNAGDNPWEILPPIGVHDQPEDFPEMIAALEDEIARNRGPQLASDRRDGAVLVHVSAKPRAEAEESMAELRELARSAGIRVVHEILQRRPIDPKYVLGEGKLKYAVIKAMQVGAQVLVFDMNLTPAQVKAVADFTDLKALDRTQVILDIFAQHAQTREGKIQVELAQLRYLLPRLSAKHTAMSRLTGGIGGRGPGETKLEVDRRRAKDRIALLTREVEKLGDQRKVHRGLRTKKGLPVVSIVGYTNAGKSTLLNNLTESHVAAENALFATLNPVSRRLRFPREREIVVTDTVGFIRDIPPDLMAAFHTTFEELQEADLLLHVVDASSGDVETQFATVVRVLAELELDRKPMIAVLNKIDRSGPEIAESLARRYNGIPISALDRATFAPLLEAIESHLWPDTGAPRAAVYCETPA